MIQFNFKIHPELYGVHFKLGDTIKYPGLGEFPQNMWRYFRDPGPSKSYLKRNSNDVNSVGSQRQFGLRNVFDVLSKHLLPQHFWLFDEDMLECSMSHFIFCVSHFFWLP